MTRGYLDNFWPDSTRPVEAHENHYPLTRDNFYLDPLDPWKKLLLTRITRDIFSSNIFTKSETFWSEMPIFGQIYVDFAKKFHISRKIIWPVWPVNILSLTRLTRNIFPLDPPTHMKIFGWPVTRPDPWNFQICWPDPARPVENFLLPDPTRPVATRSIPSQNYLSKLT